MHGLTVSALETTNLAGSDASWSRADELEAELEPAFEALYREHYAFVWRSARRMLASEADVEDAIQDTFSIAYRRFDRYDGSSRASTWLFGILRNVVRNRSRGERRHQRRLAAFGEQLEARAAEPKLGLGERVLARRMLEGFLDELDADKRAVFVLAELEGMSGREIAACLEINANTAHSRLRAARRRFCQHFELPRSREAIRAATHELRERPEQPPAGARARSRSLLLVGLADTGMIGASAAPGAVGLAGLGAKLLAFAGIGVLSVAAVVVGSGVLEPETDRDRPVAIAAPAPAPDERQAGASEDTPAPAEPAPAIAIEVEAPRPKPRPAPAAPNDELAAYERLGEARSALVDGDPGRALAELEAVTAPALRAERLATEIAALCQLERIDAARARFARLTRVAPDSPLAVGVAEACWTDD